MPLRILDQYEFYIGVEEEGFTLNDKGFLAPHAYKVAENLIKRIREDKSFLMNVRRKLMGLQWEPSPTQIEYVTRPLSPEEILDTIVFSREILGECAGENELILAYLSMHPIQSNPLPINGTHINISFKEEDMRRPSLKFLNYIANYLRTYLPELIAATANTSFMDGIRTGYASNRLMNSNVLKEAPYSQIAVKPVRVIPQRVRSRFRYGVVFEKVRKYIRRIEVNPQGDRLIDLAIRGPVTNILEDMFRDPETTRIEIRFIDNQLDIRYLQDIILLLLGIVMDGIIKYNKRRKLRLRKNLSRLRWEAIMNGVDGIAEDGRTFRERLLELMKLAEKYIEYLGFSFQSNLKNGVPEIKKERMKIFDSIPILTKYRLEGLNWIRVKLSGERYIYQLLKGKKKISKSIYSGIHIPEYSIEYNSKKGLLQRMNSIIVKHILLTKEGYIVLSENDEILKSAKPLEHVSTVIKGNLNL